MAHDLQSQSRAPQTAATSASSGSQTTLETHHSGSPTATLRLRGAQQSERRHIQWAENVIDNEGLGKKSSKVCCIYHKPHEPGDSDTEGDSSSADSDNEADLSRAQRSGDGRKSEREPKHRNDKGKGTARKASPNAYERQPKHKHTQTD